MSNQEDIASYQRRLATHRRTLAHLLKQREDLDVLAPPAITNAIAEARGEIQRIKAELRAWGAVVVDEANDEEPLPPLSPPVELPDLFPMANNLIGQQEHFDHVCELFDHMAQEGRGHFVFLTGQPGHGRTALAQSVAEELRASGAGVLLARFWPLARLSEEDQEALWSDDPLLDPAVAALEPHLAQAWPRAARIAGRGWVRLAAQVAYLLERVPTPQGERLEDDPTALKGLLRHAARRRPLVFVLERLEHAPDLWIDVLRDLAPEIERDLPLLVLVALEAPRRLEELPKERYSEAMHLAHTLHQEGRADVLWLGPVSVEDVAAYISPAEGRLARRLHELAGGVPAIVESLWDTWEHDGVVAQREDGTWQLADDTRGWVTGDLRDPVLRLLAARLDGAAPFDRAVAEEILGCAALEGLTFTAQAVARVLDLDKDTLLDFLDDYLLDEEQRPGLVAEVGFLPIPAAPIAHYPNLYRFAYPYLWHLWARYGLPERRRAELQLRLAEVLERVYYPATDMVAERLVALFEGAGHPQRAEPYRRRLRVTADIVVLGWQVDLLERAVASKRASALEPTAADDFDRYRLFELRLELSVKLYGAGRYQEGYAQAEAALRMAEAWKHPILEARARNLVGMNLERLGRYAEALPYYKRALAIREQVLGEHHPDTASSLNNLGILLQAQGDLAGARPYYERALAITKQVLGEHHPDTASSLNSLGYLFHSQGDLARARPYYERALAIREQVLGERHPDTATSLNNLGGLLRAQGDLPGARLYYERALAITKQVLGEHHPDTATSLNNLGALLRAQGDLPGALSYFERALVISEAVFGEQHPDTARSIWWLGTLLGQSGDTDAAREQLQRALVILMQTLGPAHPKTQQCQRDLAALDHPHS